MESSAQTIKVHQVPTLAYQD
jgi:phosphoglucomutase